MKGRRGYRNEFYERKLVTPIAIVQGARVPGAQDLSPERAVLGRSRRRYRKGLSSGGKLGLRAPRHDG